SSPTDWVRNRPAWLARNVGRGGRIRRPRRDDASWSARLASPLSRLAHRHSGSPTWRSVFLFWFLGSSFWFFCSRFGKLRVVDLVLILHFQDFDVDVFLAVAIDDGFLRLLGVVLVLKLRDNAFLVHFLLSIEIHGPVLEFNEQPGFLVEKQVDVLVIFIGDPNSDS